MSHKTTGPEQNDTASLGARACGIVAGTEIMTLAGSLPVEFLTPGERIITRDRGAVTLDRITYHDLSTPLVEVAFGALGHDRPERTLLLLPDQEVLIRDWRARALYGRAQALVAAARLVDGTYVKMTPARRLRVFSLGFDVAHVIYAGGVELSAPLPARAAQHSLA